MPARPATRSSSMAIGTGGVVRRLPPLGAVGDTLVPGLTVEMLRVATAAPAFTVQSDRGGVRAVGVGDVRIPTDADGTMWIHYTPHAETRFVSAAAVLAGDVPTERLERKLVLVGVTALGLADQHVTPLGERLSGVEIHAQALENVFDGRVLVRPHWTSWAEPAALAGAGGLVIALTPTVGMVRAAVLAIGLGAALLGGSFAAYRHLGLLLDGLTPTLGLGLVFTAALGSALAEADRHRRALRQRLQEEREAAARLAGELEAARRIQLGLLPRPESAFPGEGRFRSRRSWSRRGSSAATCSTSFSSTETGFCSWSGMCQARDSPPVSSWLPRRRSTGASPPGTPPSWRRTMCEANAEMGRDNPEAFFVTLVAVVLDVNTGHLWHCNAGHEAPWVVRPGAEAIERLEGGAGPAALRPRWLPL